MPDGSEDERRVRVVLLIHGLRTAVRRLQDALRRRVGVEEMIDERGVDALLSRLWLESGCEPCTELCAVDDAAEYLSCATRVFGLVPYDREACIHVPRLKTRILVRNRAG